jgi:hypothetical protein
MESGLIIKNKKNKKLKKNNTESFLSRTEGSFVSVMSLFTLARELFFPISNATNLPSPEMILFYIGR